MRLCNFVCLYRNDTPPKLIDAVYEYHRDADLIANTFNANMNNQARGPIIWNQPGVTVDGPVYIPKVYDGRNKTFFMFSWEAIKKNWIPGAPQTVPTPLERTGNFSDLHQSNGSPITIYDPSTTGLGGGANLRLPFPQNTIPQSRFDPISSEPPDVYPSSEPPNGLHTEFLGVLELLPADRPRKARSAITHTPSRLTG